MKKCLNGMETLFSSENTCFLCLKCNLDTYVTSASDKGSFPMDAGGRMTRIRRRKQFSSFVRRGGGGQESSVPGVPQPDQRANKPGAYQE